MKFFARQIALFCSLLTIVFQASCIVFVDPPEHFFRPTQLLVLEGADGKFAPVYRNSWDKKGFGIELYVLHGVNSNLDPDSNQLTINMLVYPKDAHNLLVVTPQNIKVTVGADSLVFSKMKTHCSSRFGRCSYLIGFRMTNSIAMAFNFNNRALECTIDLSKGLIYDSLGVEVDKISCRMPRDSTWFAPEQ